jgi:nitroimidazol reductase NimA-like FMN-containing flavoprotein (pyridoxamine 5'-phosphate oxidase superfamily)
MMSVLDRDTCLQLLATQQLARLAFTRRALPDIIPVNYVLDGEELLIQLDPGSDIARAVTNAVVALEVDLIDQALHTGWSVTVIGEAQQILDPAARRRSMERTLTSWAGGRRDYLLSISSERVTGRLLREPNSSASA